MAEYPDTPNMAPISARRLGGGPVRALTLTTAVLALAWAAPAAAQQTPAALACDGSLESALADLPQTKILLVKTFRRGEPLVIDLQGRPAATVVEGAPQAPAPIAVSDFCLVKLRVSPGDPGPEGAPSTSAGIGIEILLPDPADWNGRIRAYGNSGRAGTPQASLSVVASDDLHAAAAGKGFVVATSDNGHVGSPIDRPLR